MYLSIELKKRRGYVYRINRGLSIVIQPTELEEREQHYIDLYKDIIVNQKNATTNMRIIINDVRDVKECNGSQICEHNKLRYRCVESARVLVFANI